MIQGSEEWIGSRIGYATASCFSDVMAKGKGITRTKYMRRLVAERLTGKPFESYVNGDILRGKEQEPLARMEYEAFTGNLVQEVGFVRHEILLAGASPDGLIDDDGGIEIKSVKPTVQIETIEQGGYPYEHVAQIQGNLWITGRKWWDFVSYSPDMPEPLRLYVYRVYRNEAYIVQLEEEVMRFLDEADALYQRLMNAEKCALSTLDDGA